MTKNDLINVIADGACITKKDAKHTFEKLISAIQEVLAVSAWIVIPGIGKLTVTHRPAREDRNPRTGKKLQIPAGKKITFKAAKELKEAV